MGETLHNWAGNIAYAAKTVHTPRSAVEIQDIVRKASKARGLGSRHSFNRIADTEADLISLRGLNKVISIDKAKRQVTVEGGITYGELCPILDAEGFALHNLASLPHISVVGAVTTATHGSGEKNKNLAAAVAGLKIITASGETLSLSRSDAEFNGAVVSLGALGIVSEITLDIQPRFEVRQDLYVGLPFSALLDNLDAIEASAYSVSLFTAWQGDNIDLVWLKGLADAPGPSRDMFGAHPADRPYHPIISMDPAPCTEQMGVAGPWHLRLPHFRMEFQPSAGAELQSEYFVARSDAVGALKALKSIQDKIAPPLMISEIRTMAADDQWMSMNYQQDSLAFHFTWKQDWSAVSKVLPLMEAALAPFRTRPHWGKLFTMPPRDIQSRYPRIGDFRALVQKHDAEGKFRNAFVADCIF
jgi:alditol oxidase